MPTKTMKPEEAYIVQVMFNIEISARDPQEARDIALAELARNCEKGRDLIVRVEKVKV